MVPPPPRTLPNRSGHRSWVYRVTAWKARRVNELHLQYCASDEWAEACAKWIIPGALEGVALGDDVLEVGPGPGRTTDLLRSMVPRLTAVEIDDDLAAKLTERM